MVVVFTIAIGAEAIFLIIAGMARYSLIGVDFLNMRGHILVDLW